MLHLISAITTKLFDSPDPGPTGAAGVQSLIEEFGAVREGTYEAELGEPAVEANEGRFTSDPKITVPVTNTKYGDGGTLVFDVPMGPEDDQNGFADLLDAFGLDFATLAQLEGQTVPVQYTGGNIFVMWDQVDQTTDSEIEDPAQ